MTIRAYAIGAALFACAVSGTAYAADTSMVKGPDEVQWGPAPPALPPGAQMAVMAGDPGARASCRCGPSCPRAM